MPLQGYWWAGRDNATLTEPALSRVNCSKTRMLSLRAARYAATITTPAYFVGGRVHAVPTGVSDCGASPSAASGRVFFPERGCVGRFLQMRLLVVDKSSVCIY